MVKLLRTKEKVASEREKQKSLDRKPRKLYVKPSGEELPKTENLKFIF